MASTAPERDRAQKYYYGMLPTINPDGTPVFRYVDRRGPRRNWKPPPVPQHSARPGCVIAADYRRCGPSPTACAKYAMPTLPPFPPSE
jgi:hypothetical protein